MVRVELTSASNGVVKRVVDDNANGAGTVSQVTKVYPIEGRDASLQTIDLISDLIDDLGLDGGPQASPHVLVLDTEWGEDYVPSVREIDDRMKHLRAELKALRNLKDALKQQQGQG